jgi:putative ABC transport system permease protein
MGTTLSDIRVALRMLARSRGFAAAALVTLALGIGANVTIFSVVDALLLRPLRYQDPERLVIVWEKNIPRQRLDNVVSPGNFIHWDEQNRAFEGMAAISMTFRATITGSGEPEELPIQFVTSSFFPLLGVQPLAGRWIHPDEERPDSRAVVLSHALWMRRFGADRSIAGKSITLDGRPSPVVGVMPPGFSFLDREVQLWAALGFNAESRTPRGRWLVVLAKLTPGVTIARAQADMDTITAGLTRQFPEFDTGWASNVVPMQQQVVGRVEPALLTLVAAVAAVLLIACANVANLLLARGATRQRELAVRAALGAGRSRLVRQMLVESLVLAVAGAAGGLLLAWWGVRALDAATASGVSLPRVDEIALDARVALFTTGLSILTAMLFGLLPALTASSLDLHGALKEGGRSGEGSRGGQLRSMFVVAQVALALVLLAGAGLLIRSFARLLDVDPGFRPERTITAKISVPSTRYDTDDKVIRFFDDLVTRIEALPGVRAAGGVSFLPLTGLAAATRFEIVGRPEPPLGESPVCDVRVATGDYFTAMGIPLMTGRAFDERDSREGTRVVIISQAMARQHWPNESPIGKRIVVSWNDPGPDEIVGVVGDIRHAGLETTPRPMIYWPPGRFAYPWTTLVVRAAADPAALAPAIIRAVRVMDSELPVADIRALDEVVSRSVAERRLVMGILAGFALVALVLAAVGIYGVMAYAVAQRTREIGVRMALGARPGDILRLVLGRAVTLTAAGVGLGVAAAAALTRFMTRLLFDTEPTDPLVFGLITVALAAVALAASAIPGCGATRVDPLIALRAE